ncbi:DUF3164 family protein [Ferrimonas sp.]|uniref:DUF3164 family protein n=1 Tax=Ferrimonas sp. TaxID=2080861 RepID=UPI003A8E3FCC
MTTMQPNTNLPAGYRKNARGDLVPEANIKAVDKLRDELVVDLIKRAGTIRSTMAQFKQNAFEEILAFVDLSAAEYDVKYGGTKGNVTLTSFDGQYRVIMAKADHRVFDERIQVAKGIIDDCIHRWSEGSNDNIKVLVNQAFKVDKQGQINVNQVLSLRQLEINDDHWKQAMEAISDAIQVVGTATYLRFYQRRPNGSYSQLPLDLASA